MGGRVKKMTAWKAAMRAVPGILLAAFLTAALPARMVLAAEGTMVEESTQRIEQVYTNLPEIMVYGYGLDTVKGQNTAAYLGTEELTWQGACSFRDSGEGIYLYFLLDISGSMPKSYFKEIKNGILNLQERLGENDRLVLCTFGEEVRLLADGSQKTEEMRAILDTVENHDQKTLLFEAVDRVGAIAAKTGPEECRRRVLVVISDGEDIAVGKKMAQEAQETLKEYGLPLYGMCIRDTGRDNINSFGEFSRMSGGGIITFGAKEGSTVLTDLYDRLYDCTELRFSSMSNRVSNEFEMFALKTNDGRDTITRQVLNSRWIPDRTPPVITNAAQTGERQIRISFSEPVNGLGEISNYLIIQGDTPRTAVGAALEGGNNQNVVLTMESDLTPGTYTVSCKNMTDRSMEKNPLTGTASLHIAETENAADKNTVSDAVSRSIFSRVIAEGDGDTAGVWFLIFMALVVLIIVVAVKLKQTGKQEENRKEEVKKEEPERVNLKRFLDLVIRMDGELPRKARWEIDRSLIIGRADTCDVIFDDPKMSRQHCVLEWNGAALYVNDLNSRNGTFADGKRINVKTELKPGNTVRAGSVEITIRW